MSNIEDAVAAEMVVQGIGVINTDIFVGYEEPAKGFIPAQAVFVFQSGGEPPQQYMGFGGSYRKVFVEVIVRDEDNQQSRCLTRAQEILDKLTRAEDLPTLTGFIRIDTVEASPNYIGRNSNNKHIYHVRFSVGHHHEKV